MESNTALTPSGWQHQRVAFTGRLGLLTREQARALVAESGGEVVVRLTPHTTVLVVGAVGLPLNRKGRLNRKLQQARMLQNQQHPLAILDERQFLERSGVLTCDTGQQLFTLQDVEQMTGDSKDDIQGLLRKGLLQPAKISHGIPLFSFADIRLLQDLIAFRRRGIRTATLRRSLLTLEHLLPNSPTATASRSALEVWGDELVVRSPQGQLHDARGQLLFDFECDDEKATVCMPRDLDAEALACEEQHDLEGAIRAYEAMLLQNGPDADICFQLANALFALERYEAAAERFRQAVELESDYVEAWNNLGNVFALLGRRDDSIHAYRQALALDPNGCDARFGIADVLEEAGRMEEAALHWRLLIASRPDPEYAAYAQRRLTSG